MVEKNGLFLFVRIERTLEGDWQLCLEVKETFDNLTPQVFLKKGDGIWEVRKVTDEGVSEKPRPAEGIIATDYAFFKFKSYEEAIKELEKILNAIRQERDKILRRDGKPREFYIRI